MREPLRGCLDSPPGATHRREEADAPEALPHGHCPLVSPFLGRARVLHPRTRDATRRDITIYFTRGLPRRVHSNPAAMKAIFVSYSRSDQEPVGRMVAKLQAAGYKVWHDQKLNGGQKWWDNILEEIRGCDVLMCALSAASLESEACRKELEYAVALGKTPIPVQIADDVHLKNLPQSLSEFNAVDYRVGDEAATLKLVGAVNSCAAAGPSPAVLPEPPSIPVSYLGTLNDKVMARHKLSEDEQYAICTHLMIARSKGHTAEEIRELAGRVGKREDLLAVVKDQIDRLLASLDTATSIPTAVTPIFPREPLPQPETSGDQTVATIVQRHAAGIYGGGVHHAPRIPPAKLSNAMRTMRCAERPTDVLILHDATVFGTGENGWMVTEKAFYRKEPWQDPEKIIWHDLHLVAWTTGFLTSSIRMNDAFDLDVSGFGRAIVQTFGEMLIEIRDAIGRPLAPESNASPLEVPMQDCGASICGVCPRCGLELVWARSTRHNVIPCTRCKAPLRPR